jgi:hypothetical protein
MRLLIFIGVLYNDPVSDFYLVKANSESYLLNKTETDSFLQ